MSVWLLRVGYGEPRPRTRRAERYAAPATSGSDADVLHREVLLDALRPALAAEAGLLDAAERGRRVGDDALVDADHAELQALADADHPTEVGGEGVGDQAVLGVVGHLHRLLVLGEGADRRHRAEDLLAEQVRVGLDAGEHGGLEEVALVAGRGTAGHDLGSTAGGVVDQLDDLVALRGVDQGTDRDVLLGAATELLRRHLLGELPGEVV